MVQLDLIDYIESLPPNPNPNPNTYRGWPAVARYSVEYFAADPRTFHAPWDPGKPVCKEVTRQPGLLHHERKHGNCEACQVVLYNNFLRRGRVDWRSPTFAN